MVDFLASKRREIQARLKELGPLVEEHGRLEEAAAALAGVPGQSTSGGEVVKTAPRQRRPSGRPAAASNARSNSTGTRRGRPKGSGERGRQALTLVKDKPGITIAELAVAMDIKPNYLYRVMPSLEAEGQVAKRDGGWHPA